MHAKEGPDLIYLLPLTPSSTKSVEEGELLGCETQASVVEGKLAREAYDKHLDRRQTKQPPEKIKIKSRQSSRYWNSQCPGKKNIPHDGEI